MTAHSNSPSHGHLGTAWEIAVVVSFIMLTIVLVTTVVFQMRKKQRRKQQQAVARELDVERGRRTEDSTNDTRTAVEKGPDHSHSKASASDAMSVSTENTPGLAGLSQPSPTAQPKRLSKSSYHEYISKKPPKYYWDQR